LQEVAVGEETSAIENQKEEGYACETTGYEPLDLEEQVGAT